MDRLGTYHSAQPADRLGRNRLPDPAAPPGEGNLHRALIRVHGLAQTANIADRVQPAECGVAGSKPAGLSAMYFLFLGLAWVIAVRITEPRAQPAQPQ